jgi:hypothetical protein
MSPPKSNHFIGVTSFGDNAEDGANRDYRSIDGT